MLNRFRNWAASVRDLPSLSIVVSACASSSRAPGRLGARSPWGGGVGSGAAARGVGAAAASAVPAAAAPAAARRSARAPEGAGPRAPEGVARAAGAVGSAWIGSRGGMARRSPPAARLRQLVQHPPDRVLDAVEALQRAYEALGLLGGHLVASPASARLPGPLHRLLLDPGGPSLSRFQDLGDLPLEGRPQLLGGATQNRRVIGLGVVRFAVDPSPGGTLASGPCASTPRLSRSSTTT